jgi:hypothetical protein
MVVQTPSTVRGYYTLIVLMLLLACVAGVWIVIRHTSLQPTCSPITVELTDGLGNQLWQVAAAYTLATTVKRPLVFTSHTTPKTHHSSLNYFETILAPFAVHVAPSAFKHASLYHHTEHWGYTDMSTGISKAPVVLRGYFQHHRYVLPEFVRTLNVPQFHDSSAWITPTTVFIHVRGGDYIGSSFFDIGINDEKSDYYLRAAKAFPDTSEFLVVTNTPDYLDTLSWLKILERSRTVRRGDPTWSELTTLSVMASCPYGGICANSTFAWWGARIGHERHPTARYMFPSPFINTVDADSTSGVYFEGSHVLSVVVTK